MERVLSAQIVSISTAVRTLAAERDKLRQTNAALLDLVIRQARDLDTLREGKQ